MDIKELVEEAAETIDSLGYDKYGCAKQILSNPNLAWVIRDGDEVPLGVGIETHHVILLKKALKEVNSG